jgi:hypothetical protein
VPAQTWLTRHSHALYRVATTLNPNSQEFKPNIDLPPQEARIPDTASTSTDNESSSSEVTAQGEVTVEVKEEEITKFFNKDKAIKETVVISLQDYDRAVIRATVEDIKVHTIQNFLERYTLLARADWSTSDAAISDRQSCADSYIPTKLSANLPTALISGGLDHSRNLYQKIDGHTFLRTGMNVAVMVNVQKFQAGRLIIYAVPYPDNLHNRLFLQQNNAMGVSQLPCAYLDLQGGSNLVHFYLPHIGGVVQYDVVNAKPVLWQINIGVFNALSDPSGNTVTISLWANMDDPDFRIPTGQSAGAPPALYNTYVNCDEPNRHVFTIKGNEPEQMSGGSVVKAGLNIAAAAASAAFPEAKPIIGLVNQVAQGAIGHDQTSGNSKPVHVAPTTRVAIDNNNDFANVDGTFVSNSMAALKINSAPTAQGVFGGNHDEMNIISIVTRPTFLEKFTWAKGQSEGTQLYKFSIHPGHMYKNNIGTERVYQCTPYSYIAAHFMYWRGSFIFTINAVKTVFQSGRLEIIWVPNKSAYVDYTSLNNDTTKNVRVIWDVSESASISIVCPYVGQLPFRPTQTLRDEPPFTASTDPFCTGALFVRVLNELQVASSSVSNTIELNVMGSMGPDTSFNVPIRPYTVPYVSGASFEVKGRDPDRGMNRNDERIIKGVSLGTNQYHSNVSTPMLDLLNNRVVYNSQVPSVCFGEAIVSLRSMMKRFIDICYWSKGNTDAWFVYFAPNPTSNQGDNQQFDYNPDWVSTVQNLFAFRKGGMQYVIKPYAVNVAEGSVGNLDNIDVKFIPNIVTPVDVPISSSGTPLNYGTVDLGLEAFSMPINYKNQGFVRIDIPYYSPFPCLFNEVHRGSTDNPYMNQTFVDKGEQPTGWVAFGYDEADWKGTGRLYRSARDDFDCGFFLGVPQLLIAPLGKKPTLYQGWTEQARDNVTKPAKIIKRGPLLAKLNNLGSYEGRFRIAEHSTLDRKNALN